LDNLRPGPAEALRELQRSPDLQLDLKRKKGGKGGSEGTPRRIM